MDLNTTKSSNDTRLGNKMFDIDHTMHTNLVLMDSLNEIPWKYLELNTLHDMMQVENTCNMDAEEIDRSWEVIDVVCKVKVVLVEVAFVIVVFVGDNDVDGNDLVRIRLRLTHECAKLNENFVFIDENDLSKYLQ